MHIKNPRYRHTDGIYLHVEFPHPYNHAHIHSTDDDSVPAQSKLSYPTSSYTRVYTLGQTYMFPQGQWI